MPNGLDATLEMVPIPGRNPFHTETEALPDTDQHPDDHGPGLSLLFRAGERPDAAAIERLLDPARGAALAARISYRPPSEEGWLELLASGLTFDLHGLAPAPACASVGFDQTFGFEAEEDVDRCERVAFVPSGHIIAGAALQPVLRTMMGLAATMALDLPVRAVGWGPARTLMEPRYFARMVVNWLAGGAFPALGLTALLRGGDGSLASRGLAHFTGQEMQLESRADESPADTAKLAIRVIDFLVREGRIAAPCQIGSGPDALLVEPSQVGSVVLVWRGG